ncbi:MAG: serine/threonine protein phosphatase [Planctomycetales bacterium]|nr:serine/threonine protein phosphatase [Planctomycetales bacterium]
MRTIAIGDIHGCCQALQGLLHAIAPTSDDLLVFLGDYVDRGPDSKGVIETLLELQERCQAVFLLGNHEIMLRGALRGLPIEFWLASGGSQTVTSYGGKLENINAKHRAFLDACQPFYETEEHIFVHANYIAELPMHQQPEMSLFWEHLSDRLPTPHFSGKHVFCGHTPQFNGSIGWYGHFTCLDTGCFAGNWLSAIDVNTLETWQVSKHGHVRENWREIKRIARKLRDIWGQFRS